MTSNSASGGPPLNPLNIQPSPVSANITDLVHDLSPTTQSKVVLFLQSLRKKEATIGEDANHRPVIQYKDDKSKKLWWDASNANMVTRPKSDEDIKTKMDSCLEFIDYLKKNKPPSGLILNSSQITPKAGLYREGTEFTKTKEILGKGNMAGDIVVVKDKAKGTESAHKTMMISVFREEEIRAWVDLNETGIPPALYSFKLQDNKVHIFMEKIEKGVTLRDVIDKHMSDIRAKDPSLVHPFSLYVFHGLLSAVREIHQRGWSHRDLHPGNIMLQESTESTILTRIIDFGLAKPIDSEDGPAGFRSDIVEVIRKFTALYLDQEFDSQTDIKKNWREKLSEMSNVFNLSQEDRAEVFCLIDSALQVVTPSDVPSFHEQLANRINFDAQAVSKRVAKILFPRGNEVSKSAELDRELNKMKLVMGDAPLNLEGQGHSTMDMADGGTGDGTSFDDYFTMDDIDDKFLDNLRKHTAVGLEDNNPESS